MIRLIRSSASILTGALAAFSLSAGAVDGRAAGPPRPGFGASRLERGLGHGVTSTPWATAATPSPQATAAAPPSQPTTTSGAPQDTTEDDDGLPLEPARRLRYTATEGSWLSLDVSPDGQTIVFDLLGDLYTLPIEGGRATRITGGLAFDGQPRFSPDGARIVFTSDRDGGENLWILSLDLSDTVQVTEGKNYRFQSPEWTPDGNYVVASRAYLRVGVPKLWIYHVDGGSGLELIGEPEDLKTLGPAFGSDGRWIWFAGREGNWQYNAQFPQYQLAAFDRETGELYTRSSRYGSAFRPTLSPDGRWLAYGTRHDTETGLRIRDLATGDERWLAYPVQPDDQESRATRDVMPAMSFTPDSRAVIASWGGRIWRVPVDGSALTEIPFEAEVDLALGPEVRFSYDIPDTPTFTAQQIRDAVPSPDGSRLAFTALDKLYVADIELVDRAPSVAEVAVKAATDSIGIGAPPPDLSGMVQTLRVGEPQRLTDAAVGEYRPVWSPDGGWIAYVTWAAGEGYIWRMRADGSGEPERLTQRSAFYRELAWSPDGERIVAIRSPARGFQVGGGGDDEVLVWIPAAGGEATTIAPADGRDGPHFVASEPDRIYATGSGGTLVSFRWDGTDQRAHVRVTGASQPGDDDPTSADVVYMAPEGDRALARVLNDLYVVTVPLIGGDTPTISVANPENASFPVRRLTDIGGEFPAWSADAGRVHFSLGNAHFVHDLERAEAFRDSVASAQRAEPAAAGRPERARAQQGQAEGEDDDAEPAEYRAAEARVVVEIARDIPRGVVVLRGGRAITMRGDEIIEDADIVVRDNRIIAVGPRGSVQVPDGAEIIDVSGRTVLPGFVDTHAHLRPARDVHKPQVWQYLANLAYGVTTTRDPQTGTTDVLSYADRVRAGEILGPRIFSTGPGVFATDPPEDLDDARDMMRRYASYFDTKTIKMYVAGNREQRQWIIMAARELGLMPTTEGSLNFKLNLTEALDGYSGQEHNIPVYPLYEDIVRLFTETGIAYTPTLLVTYGGPWVENWFYEREDIHADPKLRRFMPHSEVDDRGLRRGQWFHESAYKFQEHAEFVADLVEAGGRAGVGSHGQLQGLGYHWELWAIQSGGLSGHDALRVATTIGADAIGLASEVGTIESGKLADLVVLARDPLEDIRNTNSLVYVMKNGRLYEADTLNEVWPRQRELPRQWWAETEPEGMAMEGGS